MNSVAIPPLKDYICTLLRREIIVGTWKDGQELRQEDIAKQLNVSRIPVREAFSQLVAEGMLVKKSNRHIEVIGMTAKRMRENLQMLSAIETKLCLMCCFSDLFDKYDELLRIITAYNKCVIDCDLKTAIEYDKMLHCFPAKNIDNPTLKGLYLTQYSVLFETGRSLVKIDYNSVSTINLEIYEAIKAKNIYNLRSSIEKYYEYMADIITKELKL